MIIGTHIQSYVKTTETCNLNCSHCFTSGSHGAKVYFDPDRTADFFKRLARDCPWVKSVRFLYHGGEPFLSGVDSMYRFHELTKDLFENTSYSMQTNLAFELTSDRRRFLSDVIMPHGFGTSWDWDIRFPNEKVRGVWEENVQSLAQDGHYMTMIVSMTSRLLTETTPKQVIEYASRLGFKHILFERITSDGNAETNRQIIPLNRDLDAWILKMYEESLSGKFYDEIGNMLLHEIATAYVNRDHVANRCRECEQTLLTINADGSIAGCPNTAPKNAWGNINWRVMDSLKSPKRLKTIACETSRNTECYTCPVSDICNGDCYQLGWDEGGCASPKSLFMKMKKEGKVDDYRKFIYA